MLRPSRLSLALLCVLTASPPRDAIAAREATIGQLAQTLGLSVQTEGLTPRHILMGGTNRVVVCPGFAHALVNGRVVKLDSPARYDRGELRIPPTFVDLLKGELSPRARAERPTRAHPPRPAARRWKVVIDAGHGGRDPGAVKAGLTEKSVNLDVATKLKPLLEKAGCDVVMTRTRDVAVPLQNRVAIANRARADVFLSIHANAEPRGRESGCETLYVGTTGNAVSGGLTQLAANFSVSSFGRVGSDALLREILVQALYEDRRVQSKHLADRVQQVLAPRLKTKNRGTRKDVRDLCVLRGVTCPRALVEVGFLSSSAERRHLSNPWYRERIARALAEGVLGFLQAQREW